MRSFDYSKLYEKAWDTDILNLVAKIHECKGRQDLFFKQKPVILARSNKRKMYLSFRAVYAEALNTWKQSIPRIKTL